MNIVKKYGIKNNGKSISEEIIAELKSIPIHDVCDVLNINHTGDCPTGHDSENHNCFHTWTNTNTWGCFHCRDNGRKNQIDTIGLVKAKLNCEFVDACKFLAEQFSPELADKINNISLEDMEKIKAKRDKEAQVLKALSYAMGYYEKKLSETPEALEYITSRGVTEDFIKNNSYVRFGYAPINQYDLRCEMIKTFGEEITFLTGIFKRENLHSSVKCSIFEGKIFKGELPGNVYSYEVGGQTKYICVRSIKGKHFSKLKNVENGILKNEIFGIDSLGIKNPDFKNSILIAEGLFDAITAIQNNIPTISPITIQFSQPQIDDMVKVAKRFDTIYIVPDPDKAGETGATKTARLLFEAGKNVKVVSLPRIEGVNKLDLADYFLRYTYEDFLTLCSSASSLIDFIINTIPKNTSKSDLGKKFTEKNLINLINVTDAFEKEEYIKKISQRFETGIDSVKSFFLNKQIKPEKETPNTAIPPIENIPSPTDADDPNYNKPSKKKSQKPVVKKEEIPGMVIYSDMWNSKKIVELYKDDIRYCKKWKEWMIWNGKNWEDDETGQIQEMGKQTVRSFYSIAADMIDDLERSKFVKHIKTSENINRRKAMIEGAQSEPGIPVKPEKFDRDRFLINVSNGTLNLKTMKLLPHDRQNYITKIIDADYNPAAVCPVWEAFLNRIFDGNENLITFIKKAVGYSLTGSTQEQCIFILHGSGANGKSTFTTTIKELLGDYAQQTPSETLMAKKQGGNATNDLARLRGVRFISSVETEEGRAFAEVLIKQLSGDDVITARFLFKEYFDFRPEGKIFIATNHEPKIRGTDPAIWRRIRKIPFSVTIPEEERDHNLLEKLKSEYEGILTWAVDGCKLWQQEGLKAPDEVKAATDEYRNNMDVIADFINECCIIGDRRYQSLASDLYKKYSSWCEETGEYALSQKLFGNKLSEHGYRKERSHISRNRGKFIYIGIKPLDEKADEQTDFDIEESPF